MLYLLYFALMFLAFTFFVIGLLRKELAVIMPILAMALFFILGIPSFAIEIPFCNDTAGWSCFVYAHNTDYAISYLFLGMGVISLALSIYAIIYGFAEQVSQPPAQPREL